MTTFAAAPVTTSPVPSAEVTRARVAVMVADYQVDVVVPTTFSVETFIDDLLAVLAEAIGEEIDLTPPVGQWSLARPGRLPIPRWRSLADDAISDGAVLMLCPVESAEVFTPVVEDITDALAMVNTREFAEFDADTSFLVGLAALVLGSIAVAAMLAWSWTATGSAGWSAVPALLWGSVCWGGALVARNWYASARVCVGLTLSALPLLFVGAATLVPPAYGQHGSLTAANIAAGSVLATIAAAAMLRIAKLGVGTLMALALLGSTAAAMSLLLAYSSLTTTRVATGAVLVGLVMLGLAPRFAVLIARIRPPDLPDPGDAVSPTTLNDIFDGEADQEYLPDLDIESRARLAVTSLIGLIVAVSILIPTAAVAAAALNPGGVREEILAAAVAAIVALRSRSFPDRVQATALIAAAIVTVAGVGFVAVTAAASPFARLAATVLVAGALLGGCLAATLLPGVRLSPVTRRMIDLVEYALILIVPVVAFMIMGVYTAARRI